MVVFVLVQELVLCEFLVQELVVVLLLVPVVKIKNYKIVLLNIIRWLKYRTVMHQGEGI